MRSWRTWLDRRFYPNYQSNWDDELLRERVMKALEGKTRVLDFGAGRGRLRQMNFRGHVPLVCGVDVAESVLENNHLDEARVISSGRIPYPDEHFDVVVANNVLEHLERPRDVLHEIGRVLTPGGILVAKTPNRYHYVGLVAAITPLGFHQWINRIRGRPSKDTFPTFHRANTARTLRRLAVAAGFHVDALESVEGRPEYMRFTLPTYLLGLVYERFVNKFTVLAPLRAVHYLKFRRLPIQQRSAYQANETGL